MRRRIMNMLLYKVKVGDHRATWEQAAGTLEMMLSVSMEGAAQRRFGPQGDLYTRQAVSISMDRIRACRMHYVSPQYERDLLQDAYRQGTSAQDLLRTQQQSPPQTVTPKPQWYLGLIGLIALTRRSWIYMRMAGARDHAPGWLGRLAEVYLGDAGRQSRLSIDRRRWDELMDEVEDAYHDLVEDAPRTPVLDVLARINAHPMNVGDNACADYGRNLGTILDLLDAHHPASGYTSCRQPLLAETWNDIVDTFCPLVHRVVAAAEEFYRAQSQEGGCVLAKASGMLDLLNDLHCDHPNESRPADVLAAIDKIAWRMEASPPEPKSRAKAFTREKLLPRLRNRLECHTPEWAVFIGMLMCYDLQEACEILANWLPAPTEMLPGNLAGHRGDWLERAQKILSDWREVMIALRTDHQPDITSWLEIPPAVLANPIWVEDALTTVANWIEDPALAPTQWKMVPLKTEPALRAALFVVVMEELMESMRLVYEEL